MTATHTIRNRQLVTGETPLCALGRTRTSDTRFRKPVLYPLSYEGMNFHEVPGQVALFCARTPSLRCIRILLLGRTIKRASTCVTHNVIGERM